MRPDSPPSYQTTIIKKPDVTSDWQQAGLHALDLSPPKPRRSLNFIQNQLVPAGLRDPGALTAVPDTTICGYMLSVG
jgi:hypothetical protein